jgi:hypothetical protein
VSFIRELLSASIRRESLPIFPLQAVMFPGAVLPLRIFEVRYIDMARDCLRAKKPFGICLIKEGGEVGTPAVPESVGCTARIADCDVEEGVMKIRAEGLERFRIVATEVTRQSLIVAEVEKLTAEPEVTDVPGLVECAAFLAKAIIGIGEDRFAKPYRLEDATWVGFRLAEILPLRNDVKQKLLEITDAQLRLAVLHRFLRQQKLIE